MKKVYIIKSFKTLYHARLPGVGVVVVCVSNVVVSMVVIFVVVVIVSIVVAGCMPSKRINVAVRPPIKRRKTARDIIKTTGEH